MSCDVCTNFSPPGPKAVLVARDNERWTELYRCPSCGAYWETGVLEWHARELPVQSVKEKYPLLELNP